MLSSSAGRSQVPPSYWVAVVLVVTGAVLASNPLPFHSPVSEAVLVPPWAIDPAPVRRPRREPSYPVAVYSYRCSDCHAIITPRAGETYRTATQHREIRLEHGINTSCFNCHHPSNRDVFVGDDGVEIPWGQSSRLCAKCHGPVFRDWQHGAHGRTNGYWDTSRGVQTRRGCIECHDPHRPPFPGLPPAPPPHSLRAGAPRESAFAAPPNPLRLGGVQSEVTDGGPPRSAAP